MPYAAGGVGLVEGEWHLRDLTAPDADAIAARWYEELVVWRHVHHRDHISLPYVLWALRMLPGQAALPPGGSGGGGGGNGSARGFRFARSSPAGDLAPGSPGEHASGVVEYDLGMSLRRRLHSPPGGARVTHAARGHLGALGVVCTCKHLPVLCGR